MAQGRGATNGRGHDHEADSPSRGSVVGYVDGAGIPWRAYERHRPGQPPALVFESSQAVRIVRDFPDNWYTLPRAALEALSWSV
jgi:hypothetical protein